MRILVYKRTHNGDPDEDGRFGAHDCMGSIRSREYDAVIGVGGLGPEARSNGIAGKVNWIGIGPHKVPGGTRRGPLVTFDNFRDYGTDGPDLATVAPALAERMYGRNVRSVLHGLTARELAEAKRLLRRVRSAPPSAGSRGKRLGELQERSKGCAPSRGRFGNNRSGRRGDASC